MDFMEDFLLNGTAQEITFGETTIPISRELFVGALFTLLACGVFVAFACRTPRTREDEKSVERAPDLNVTLQAPAPPTGKGEVVNGGGSLHHGTGEGRVESASPIHAAKSSSSSRAGAFDRSPSYKYDDRNDDDEQGEQEKVSAFAPKKAAPEPAPTTPKRRAGRGKKPAAPSASAAAAAPPESDDPLRRSVRKKTPRKFYASY